MVASKGKTDDIGFDQSTKAFCDDHNIMYLHVCICHKL